MSKLILITGGAGFIGSHTCVELLASGHKLLVLDNLSNAHVDSLYAVSSIAGVPLDSHRFQFVRGDVRDALLLDRMFSQHAIHSVFHFAGLKAVSESVTQPLIYFSNNVEGTLVLLQAMAKHGCHQLVFSSSATIYGAQAQSPIAETSPVSQPANPYGSSKLTIENMLIDLAAADLSWSIAILRYFNPVGAHESGCIGEDPHGIPNNLLPYIAKVAARKLNQLSIFGSDYPTADGTGVRDYVHVVDLAVGHLRALEALQTRHGAHVWNLGTGKGHSVLEVVKAFEAASGCEVPYKFVGRRPGDLATCYADPSKAMKELNWKPQRVLTQMMQDAWRWQIQNQNGFGKISTFFEPL